MLPTASVSVEVEGIIPGGNAVVIGPADIEPVTGERTTVVAVGNVGEFEPLILAESVEMLSGTDAQVRIVHAAPDAPGVDIIAGDNLDAPVVAGLAFPEATPYVDTAPGELNVKVLPEGATQPEDAVIDASLEYAAGAAYSIYATGFVADIEALRLDEDLRRVGTEARVRPVHASPSTGEVDIYVVEPGASIDDADPAFTEVSLGADTGYVALAAGEYDVAVTPTGGKDAAIGPVAINVEAGGTYTAAARDAAGMVLRFALFCSMTSFSSPSDEFGKLCLDSLIALRSPSGPCP